MSFARALCRSALFLVALLFSLLPAGASAGWFGFRNDTSGVIVVKQSAPGNNRTCPMRPLVLYPGEMAWDSVVQPGEHTIAIFDPARPHQPLFEKKVHCSDQPLLYSVTRGAAGQVTFEKTAMPVATKKSGR